MISDGDKDIAFDQGFQDTQEWLDEGAVPQMQPKPPTDLTKNQLHDWWRGSHAAFDTQRREADIYKKHEDMILCAIMFLFFLFGAYLVFTRFIIVQLLGVVIIYFSGSVIFKIERGRKNNQK